MTTELKWEHELKWDDGTAREYETFNAYKYVGYITQFLNDGVFIAVVSRWGTHKESGELETLEEAQKWMEEHVED